MSKGSKRNSAVGLAGNKASKQALASAKSNVTKDNASLPTSEIPKTRAEEDFRLSTGRRVAMSYEPHTGAPVDFGDPLPRN